MTAAEGPNDQLLTLRAGGQVFAIPAALVREIVPLPARLTRVPHAPAALMGLANVRGAVLPVLSLASLTSAGSGAERRVVIVGAGETAGLAVDEVSSLAAGESAAAGEARRLDVAELLDACVPSAARGPIRKGMAGTKIENAAPDDRLGLVVFAIGRQELALPVTAVEAMLAVPPNIAWVPFGDDAVLGTASVEGAVLPLLSVAALLGVADVAPGEGQVLVTRIGSARVGLLVGSVRAIVQVPESAVDPLPAVLARGGAEARVQAICRLDEGSRLVSVLAADQLLREDLTAQLTQSTGERTAAPAKAEEPSEQFLIFTVGTGAFGLPVEAIEEVTLLPATLTRLPNAPAFVRGMMNVRGQVIPVIDQSQRFGGAAGAGARRRVLVVAMGALKAGFLVDEVSGVVPIDPAALRPAPELGSEETRVFERVASLAGEQRLILIVSPDELLGRAERDMLSEVAGRRPVVAA